MNKLFIAGNLGDDAKTHTFASGAHVMNFTVAVSSRQKNSEGNWEDKTTWFDCKKFYGKDSSPEKMAGWMKKGTKVTVCGEVSVRTYEKSGGGFGATLEIKVDMDGGLTLQGSKGEGGGAAASSSAPQTHGQAVAAQVANSQDDSDDLPF